MARVLDEGLVQSAGQRQLPGLRLCREQNGVLMLFGNLFDLSRDTRPTRR